MKTIPSYEFKIGLDIVDSITGRDGKVVDLDMMAVSALVSLDNGDVVLRNFNDLRKPLNLSPMMEKLRWVISGELTDTYLRYIGDVSGWNVKATHCAPELVKGDAVSSLQSTLYRKGWHNLGTTSEFIDLVESLGFRVVTGRNRRNQKAHVVTAQPRQIEVR